MFNMPGTQTLRRRSERSQVRRAVSGALISLAGLLGRPVFNQTGEPIGTLVDVVCRWVGEPYPPVTGLVVKVGRARAYIPVQAVALVAADQLRLGSSRVDLREFQVRSGEVRLAHDVLDHQLVDTDGIRVFRASDLYLAQLDGGWGLVGAEVGLRVLLRRIGPSRWRSRPAPEKVLDWSAVQALGGSAKEGAAARQVRVRSANAALTALRPAELADLLAELSRQSRQELLSMVRTDAAADALEEMEPAELESLLRHAPTAQAAALLAAMEPDEAVDALRDLSERERGRLLAAMAPEAARQLRRLLGYAADTAAGVMTSALVTVSAGDTVADVVRELRSRPDSTGLDAVCVLDDAGRLVDDVSTMELLLAGPDSSIGALVGPPWPVAVRWDLALHEVIERFIDGRSQSVVVIDDDDRPIGRILADDLVDAMVPDRGRFRVFPLIP